MTLAPATILRDLFLPRTCVSCGTSGTWWCPGCDGLVTGSGPVMTGVADVVVCSATTYEGAARSLILGLKERHLTALAPPAGALLAAAIQHHPRMGEATTIVPIPGSSRGWRARGFDALDLILGETPDLAVSRCLDWNRHRRAQKSLTRAARASNLVSALAAQSPPRRALVVDDIVTTGATVTEGIRAIRAAGGSVVGVASIAHTPPVGGPVGRAGQATR